MRSPRLCFGEPQKIIGPMRCFRLTAFALAVSFASVSSAPLAFADPSSDDIATAKALGQEGVAALEAKDYKKAEDRLGRAWKLYPDAITLGLNYARALAAEGKLVAAQVAYNKVANTALASTAPEPFVNAKATAQTEVQGLAARIGAVVITVTGEGGGDLPNLKVTLDGDNVNVAGLGVKRPVDAGNHTVSATADGFLPGEAKFSMIEGGNAQAQITLAKAPPGTVVAPPAAGAGDSAAGAADTGGSGKKTAAWVAYGIGGAGLIAGGITGILAISKHSSLSSECPNGSCPPGGPQSDLSSYHTMGLISTIGFGLAIVGGGLGTYFLLTAPSGQPAPQTTGVHPFIGPGVLGAVGRF
jgi:hypothetical protein